MLVLMLKLCRHQLQKMASLRSLLRIVLIWLESGASYDAFVVEVSDQACDDALKSGDTERIEALTLIPGTYIKVGIFNDKFCYRQKPAADGSANCLQLFLYYVSDGQHAAGWAGKGQVFAWLSESMEKVHVPYWARKPCREVTISSGASWLDGKVFDLESANLLLEQAAEDKLKRHDAQRRQQSSASSTGWMSRCVDLVVQLINADATKSEEDWTQVWEHVEAIRSHHSASRFVEQGFARLGNSWTSALATSLLVVSML